MTERKIVVPGETIAKGEEYLPGDGTRREGDDIVASRFGLSDMSDKLIRVIPLSGVYAPRRGNVIIGQVVDITFNGWLIDFGGANSGFLSIMECPMFINKDELQDTFNFGDMLVAKVTNVKAKGIDLTVKIRGLGKLEKGMIIKINPNKVPRVIGKEGSMVSLIKDAVNCNITIGQNGLIWIRGDAIDNELEARKIIDFICENSSTEGLTEKVKNYIDNTFPNRVKENRPAEENN
jgi:exosome complex component RRP4